MWDTATVHFIWLLCQQPSDTACPFQLLSISLSLISLTVIMSPDDHLVIYSRLLLTSLVHLPGACALLCHTSMQNARIKFVGLCKVCCIFCGYKVELFWLGLRRFLTMGPFSLLNQGMNLWWGLTLSNIQALGYSLPTSYSSFTRRPSPAPRNCTCIYCLS